MYDYFVNKDESFIAELEKKLKRNHARQMGHMENFFGAYQRQELYKSFAVLAKFNQKINDEKLLFHAIRPILLKYPILATTIVNQDVPITVGPRPNDYIMVKDQIKFGDLFLELSDEIKNQKDEEFYNSINQIILEYGDGALQWKLAIIDDYTLVLIVNHVVSDGTSAKFFFQDLEEQLNKYQATTVDHSPAITPKTLIFDYEKDLDQLGKFPPPIEVMVDYRPTFSFVASYFANQWVVKHLCPSFKPTPNVKMLYRKINISGKQLSQIKQSLRNNEVDKRITITPYIAAALLNAEHKVKLYGDNYRYTTFNLAVDTRTYLPPDANMDEFKYGFCNSAFNKWFYKVQEFSWDNIRYFNNYFKQAVADKTPLYLAGLVILNPFTKNKNMDQVVVDFNKNRLRTNVFLSNVGLVESKGEHYKIIDAVFTQNFRGNFYECSMNVIGTKQGGINIVLSIPETVTYNEDKLDEFVHTFHRNLISECDDE